MKVLIINGSAAYTGMFEARGWDIASSLHDEDLDLVVFTGGADVDPGLYGEAKHKATSCNYNRDSGELIYYEYCKIEDIPMVGICRGAQFLNVMNGGKLFQDVNNHTGTHNIIDKHTGEIIAVTSTHHQMMRPEAKGDVIATCSLATRKEYMKGAVIHVITDKTIDFEVVHYNDSRCLCVQFHPEFADEACQDYFFSLLERTLHVG